MKTLETILNEYSKEVTGNDAETFESLVDDGNGDGIGISALNIVKECHARYISQFHPTPTEAEINEAAEVFYPVKYKNMFEGMDIGKIQRKAFANAIQWLQNYQTQGMERPVASSDIAGIVKVYYNSLHSWQDANPLHLIKLLNEWQASHPNPAIAVIETEIKELEQNYKDMPNHADGITFAIQEFSIVLNKVKNLSR